MTRFSIPLAALSLVLFGTAALGEEPAGIPAEIIKQLDALVGTWQVEGQVGDQAQTGTYTCWWGRTEDKKQVCLVGRFSYRSEKSTRRGMNLIGWNAVKKCIEDRGFDANGGNAVLYWTPKSPTEWAGESVMVADGKELKSTGVLIKKGPAEIVTESRDEAGTAARFVFRKVPGKPKK